MGMRIHPVPEDALPWPHAALPVRGVAIGCDARMLGLANGKGTIKCLVGFRGAGSGCGDVGGCVDGGV